MKNAIMGFLKSNIKWIIGIFIIIVLLIFLASSSYVLKLIDSSNSNHSSGLGGLNFGGNNNNMNARVENEISSQVSVGNIVSKGNGDYKFNINLDDKVNELYEEFSKSEEGRRKLNYITGTEEEKKELLKDMIRAELITQYPDLRTVSNMNNKVDSDEVQGVIRFKRVLSEPTIRKVASIKKSEDTSIELNGGIVCWGDEFTLGDAEDSSNNYPALLAEKLQKNVYNLGFEGVTSQEIALLAGVDKYTLVTTNEEDVTIGKELGSEVTISVSLKKDDNIMTQTPFKTFDGSDEKKKLECTINGVDGELTYKEDSGTYVFKRKTEGEEIKISKDSIISLKTQSGYKSAFPIIWIGNGNSYINYKNTGLVKNIVEDCWSLINMATDPDNYIVIIPTHYRDSNGELKKYESNEYDAIKKVFMEEAGFNTNQVLDLRDKINDGSEYSVIVDEIEKCMEKNNIKTKISGEYNQNISNSEIIKLSNEYLPSDGTAITLEYIPLGNALEPAPGTLMWLINNDDVEIQKAALQYFSIDASGNLIVANWSKVTTTIENFTDADGNRDGYVYDNGYPTTDVQYTIVPSKVNYKDSTSQYTMPFDYLWTWMVMGDDTEFVRKLTDLTLNSSIEATLYDELTAVENDVVDELTNGYRTHYKEVSDGYQYYTQEIAREIEIKTRHLGTSTREWDSVRYEDKKNHTNIVTETNKIRYRLTYADVWNLTYKVDGVERLEYKGEEGKDSVSFDDSTTTTVGVKKQDIEIPGNRTNIKATIFIPEGTQSNMPLVLMCHGFTGTRNGDGDNGGHFNELGNKLAQNGVAAVTITFSGCQDSNEDMTKYTLENMKSDMTSAINYMKSNYSIDSGKIGLVGHSMGGRVVSDYLSNNSVSTAAIWAPADGDGLSGLEFLGDYSSYYETAKQNGTVTTGGNFNVTLSKKFFDQMNNSYPTQNIKQFRGKLLAIFDSDDRDGNGLISSNTVNAVKSAVSSQGGTYKELQSNHNFSTGEGEQIEDITLEFLGNAFGISISNESSNNNIEINDLYQKTVNDVTPYPVTWIESGAKRGPTVSNNNTANGYTVVSHEEQDYTLVKDHVITTIIIKSGYKYSSGTTSVKEKTDKNYTAQEMKSGNFSDPNFVKYYIYCTGVRNNISSMSSWLFEALENNSRTEGLVDITKYMLYKATNNDYGVTSMDFSAYNEQDFKDVEDIIINDGGNSFNGGDGTGTGGDGSLSGDSGSHYWGVYKRGDKEYKCYYQNSYSGSMHNAGCVATAAAICHSGYGSTKTPMDFWNGSGATGCGIKQISRSKSEIISYLNQNAPIVIYNSFPGGEFYGSSGGHAIVLVDVNSNGEVYVINPWHGSKWNGWYSLDYILSFSPGKNAPNTMGSSGVGVVLN